MEDLTRAMTLNFRAYQNDMFDYVFSVNRSDSGVAYPLNGKVVKMDIKKQYDKNAETVKQLDLTEGLSVGGAANNEITFDFIIDFPAGNYVYDIETSEQDFSNKRTVCRGAIEVINDITK